MQLKDESLRNLTINLLISTSYRTSFNETLVCDPGFCHGSSGCAYVFIKVWELTKIEVFFNASQYWIDFSIRYNRLEGNNSGYLYLLGDFNERKYQNSSQFLEGDIGLYLVYSQFLQKNSVSFWDGAFMLD